MKQLHSRELLHVMRSKARIEKTFTMRLYPTIYSTFRCQTAGLIP
jgi:hypothetical protein